MNQDQEHLRLLSIFHYVVAGLGALFSLFPLIHLSLGLFLVLAPEKMTGHGQQPPPAFLGWFFIVLSSVFILCGLAISTCILLAGRNLAKRKRHTFCLVVAAVECLFMPFGTVLGIFTILVLQRPSVKPLFTPANAAAVPPPPL
jgi:hypothetical protein